MKRLVLSIFLLTALLGNAFGQAGMCEDSDPFCTANIYTFPAGVNTGSAQPGPNYGCLGTQPNPAWYHMKIAVAGNINIYMYTTPSRDIDFICWGPFTDPYDPCTAQLTAANTVDCSYSPNPTETCNITNGQVGEYYILLITNYSNQPCNITFEKQSGTGETDCTIVPPPVSNNGPLCLHDDLYLYADTINNASYSWTGPAGFTSNQQNPIIYDVGFENAGAYSLIITVNGSPSQPVETYVQINALPTPDFTFNDACFGDTTYFIDQSTVEPPTSNISIYSWDFGDGQTGNNQNEEHVYGNVGTYNVTLTTSTGFLVLCTKSITKSVNVYSSAVVDAGEDITIPNGWNTQLDGDVTGGSGGYDIIWEPESLLEDPTVVDPITVNLGATQIFSLNVTDANSGCVSADSMTVIVTGGALAVNATASPMTICEGDIVNLNATPSGGSGNNQYSWTSNPPGFTASIKEPSDYPTETTTYIVEVFDGQNTVSASVTVTVKPRPVGFAGNDKTITIGTSTTIDGSSVSGGTGVYEYEWMPGYLLVDNTVLHPLTNVLNESTEFTLTVFDENGCVSIPDNMYVLTGGDALSAFPTSSANNNVICQGDVATLFPNAIGGGGNYTFHWTSDDGFSSSEENPTVNPWETTTYTIEVDDGYTTVSEDLVLAVNHTPVVDLVPSGVGVLGEDTITVCVRDTVLLDAGDPLNPPTMNYLWNTAATTRTITASTNGSWIEIETYSVNVENPATGCTGNGIITIFFDFDQCNIGVEENGLADYIDITPNPADDHINIAYRSLVGDVIIKLMDITGRIVWQKEFYSSGSNQSQVISLVNQPSGAYMLEISNKGRKYQSKVIIK